MDVLAERKKKYVKSFEIIGLVTEADFSEAVHSSSKFEKKL